MEYEAASNEAKYICALFFGYSSHVVWGTDKPAKEIAWFWFFIQPFLFGTVGASLLFSQIAAGDIGYGIVCIIVGVTVRFIVVVIVTTSKNLEFKERIFMGITWLGKATV
jgi:NhaP-type Na+/H+ or K+/H+ antiporter